MAITASGLYYKTFEAMVINSQAVDISAETYKGALFNNSITPSFSADTNYAAAPYTSNEVTGTNWASGGVALTGTAVSDVGTAGVLGLDATDVSVASTTLTNARGYLWYATGVNSGMCIVLVNFGADYSTNNGTFAITWAANGVFTIDLTP
jgi:hypothetical protein